MLRIKFVWPVILFIACTALINCGSPRSPQIAPTYSQEMSPDERAIAEKAFAVFCEACQPLMGKYALDIESIIINNGFNREKNMAGDGCLDYRCKEYGWDKQVYVQVKLKNKLAVIPSDIKAQGHTLHVYLGGPKKPGITIGKFPELCGKTKSTNDLDFYFSEPRLAFLRE
ncbi:MAG: hypothetical protein EG826_04335 [Deltaproteobacteria bacterium]|nr:hypothetical protein [Deltaproteobacteria bacterium]